MADNENPLASIAGKHQADIFVSHREKAIGSLAAPSASDELIDWNDEHIAGMSPFGALQDPCKREKLMIRRQALRYIQAYYGFAMTIKRSDRTCSVLASSNESIRSIFFDFLKEVRTLQAMYEDIRSNGPGINPDGYFRALGATAEQIRLNVGGLASYMANGEPTMITVVIKGLSPSVPVALQQITPVPTSTNAATGSELKGHSDTRKRDGDNRPERECYYCGKKGHTANVCHQRKRDERDKQHSHNNSQQHQVAPQGGAQSFVLSEHDRNIIIQNVLGQLLKK